MASDKNLSERVFDEMADAIFVHFRRYMMKSTVPRQPRDRFDANPEDARRSAESVVRPSAISKPRAA